MRDAQLRSRAQALAVMRVEKASEASGNTPSSSVSPPSAVALEFAQMPCVSSTRTQYRNASPTQLPTCATLASTFADSDTLPGSITALAAGPNDTITTVSSSTASARLLVKITPIHANPRSIVCFPPSISLGPLQYFGLS